MYVAEVARRLGERGLDVDVFTQRVNADAPTVVEMGERTRVIHVPAGPARPVSKEDLVGLVTPFAEAIDGFGESYDLVHSHYWLSGLAALQVAARRRVPLVHTMHTMARVKNAARNRRHLREPDVRARGETTVVQGADVLTANTSDEAAELAEHYGATPGQLMIVPPGVDLHTFHPCDRPKSRAQLGVPQDAEVILFVGRIQPLKAPDVLIRAAARMLERDPARRRRLKLIIIGSPSGPEADWSATLPELAASLGLHDVVEFRPHSPRDELFRWYCVSDVVGVPSYNESFGLVALEAQACGRPVVATDVGGLRHAVDDKRSGILVPGHGAAQWAHALETILDHPAVATRMGAHAAVHASRYSWDNSAAAMLSAYRLAQERHARDADEGHRRP